MNYKHILPITLLLLIVLSACQTESPSLPTLAVLPSATATELGAEATATETAIDSVSEDGTETIEILPTDTPAFELPSANDSATQAAALVPNFTPVPTTDIATFMAAGAVDLSTAAVGDTVSLLGTLTIDDTAQPSQVIVTDRNGNMLRLDLSADMVSLMVNSSVYVVGTVTSTDGGVTIQLLNLQEMSTAAISTVTPFTLPSFEATPESTAEGLPGSDATMRLASNLTALDAYDQLVGQLGAQLGSRVWILASGNPTTGWSYNFYDSSDNSVVTYSVLVDGTVLTQPGIVPLGATEIFTLSRDSITVDSNELMDTYAENGGIDDPTTLVILLQPVDETVARWSILDIEGNTDLLIDAASGDVVH